MTQSENYKGYDINWQEPPMTSAGYDLNIASDKPEFQERLERYFGSKGAHSFRAPGPIEAALKVGRTAIDAALARA